MEEVTNPIWFRSTPSGSDYHYFASSLTDWRVDKDIRELIRTMDELGDSEINKEYVVCRGPLSIESPYSIDHYRPVVEGVEEL